MLISFLAMLKTYLTEPFPPVSGLFPGLPIVTQSIDDEAGESSDSNARTKGVMIRLMILV
jgi:hypothetical protein